MDRMLYIAMSGAKQTMRSQAVNAHNLANANTAGFRADMEAFSGKALSGSGWPTRTYALDSSTGIDFTPGAVVSTGRELDVAIEDYGFIAVQTPDGGEAYTRAGDLRIASGGVVTTGAGYPVKGNNGIIALPPAEKIELGADGTFTMLPLGQSAAALAVVDRIKLVNPPLEDMVKGKDGLLRLRDNNVAPPDANVRLVSGHLESSNVNSVDSMIKMISLSRQFEMQIKMMKTTEDNDKASAALLRLQG